MPDSATHKGAGCSSGNTASTADQQLVARAALNDTASCRPSFAWAIFN